MQHSAIFYRKFQAPIQKVLPEGVQFCQRFFFGEWREDPNSTKSGPSSARKRNAIIECRLCSLLIFSGSGPILLRNPIFCDFSGEGGPDTLTPLDPCMSSVIGVESD